MGFYLFPLFPGTTCPIQGLDEPVAVTMKRRPHCEGYPALDGMPHHHRTYGDSHIDTQTLGRPGSTFHMLLDFWELQDTFRRHTRSQGRG